MAKVPLPERGQPLDLTYMYQLATAINDMSSTISADINKYTSIDIAESRPESIKTSDAMIVGGYVTVSNTSPNTSGSEKLFTYDFPQNFGYLPIVTATPYAIGDTATNASKDVTIVLTSITAGQVQGIVTFNQTGLSSVGVNLIAVGIPGKAV